MEFDKIFEIGTVSWIVECPICDREVVLVVAKGDTEVRCPQCGSTLKWKEVNGVR